MHRARTLPNRLQRLLGAVLLVTLLFGLWTWLTLPDVRLLTREYPVVHFTRVGFPTRVTLQRARPRGWVGLSEVSREAVEAIVISEDWAFYQNDGIDLNQMKKAIHEDWDRRRYARGASTITQQVVRNVFLTKNKTIWRKLKEVDLALELGRSVSKRRVLEIYLNIAEWGPGVFGIGAASRYYFDKPPAELDAKEGAFLAMLLPSPIRYGESFRRHKLTDYASETIRAILTKMTEAHELTEQEKAEEWARPLSFETAISP